MKEVFILGGARTPFAVWAKSKQDDGRPCGALKTFDPFDLGAAALRAALERSGLSGESLDRVVFANTYHVGPHACYGARYVTLRAGLPSRIPGITVNMACGSGLLAVICVAQDIADGRAHLAAAAGADSPSLIPKNIFIPSFNDISCGKQIGLGVDDLARHYGISRQAQDRWALISHERANKAKQEGRLAEEITAVGEAREDDAPLKNPSREYFAALAPVYSDTGTITRGSSHAIVDGGSALIFASNEGAQKTKTAPLGRYVAGALAALDPDQMGYASIPAIRQLLENTKLAVKDIDLFEINETFAAQIMIDIKELNIPEDKINVLGGAIAIGHPFAATGPRQILSLLLQLKRRGLRRGLASISIGGGQGLAAL
ncbi:MAG: thiolase family protein, partial [Elusimicrobiota bacterium]